MSPLTPSEVPARERVAPITWLGLFLALFGMLLVRQVVNRLYPDATLSSALMKEAGMWLVAVALWVIIKVGEHLPLSSVGLGPVRWGKSILWGIVIGIACLLVGGVIVALTHFTGGESGKSMEKLPLWLISLIVI